MMQCYGSFQILSSPLEKDKNRTGSDKENLPGSMSRSHPDPGTFLAYYHLPGCVPIPLGLPIGNVLTLPGPTKGPILILQGSKKGHTPILLGLLRDMFPSY